MKIFFNRKIRRSPWGGGAHFMSAMSDFLIKNKHEVVFSFEKNIDVIFMLDPRYEQEGCSINEIINYKFHNPKTKILHRVNECDLRKNTKEIDSILLQSMQYADSVVFISEWLQDYFIKRGFDKQSNVIYNGCNAEWFYTGKDKLSDDKIRLVTHHWSDNYMKGFDIYNSLDSFVENNNCLFTYIGRYNKSYIPKNINIIEPMYGKSLGDELRKHDVYVTASRFEPCGMHHIEGAASGLPVLYHVDGGGINEACSRYGESFSDMKSFNDSLKKIITNYDFYKNSIKNNSFDINECCEKYYKIMREITS